MATKPKQDQTVSDHDHSSATKHIETSDMASFIPTWPVNLPRPVHIYPSTKHMYTIIKDEDSTGTDKVVGAPHFGRLLPNYSYYSNNYPNYYSNNSKQYSKNADFYTDLNKRNSNSVDDSKPPLRIPDYVFYTNVNAQSNPTPIISQT